MAPDFKVRPTVNGVGVVDISAPQTLTNKTLSAPVITNVELGYTGTGNEYTTVQDITIGDIGRFQVLTIDLTIATVTRSFVTDFAISLQRDLNAGCWGVAYGKVSWHGTGGGTFTIGNVTADFKSSGTPAGGVSAITGGIRISFSSSDFSNSLTLNMAHLVTTGYDSNAITVTVTIT